MTAADILDMARRRAGVTQHELARRSGVSQPTISRIESGKMQPTVDLMLRLVAACGMELVPVDAFDDEDLDTSLIREWLEWAPAERAERAATEWNRSAGFRRNAP